MTATNYTRQSAGTIITGAAILASGLNAEFNQLVSAFDGTTGHDHSGGAGLGQKISLTNAVVGTLPPNLGGTGIANNASSTLTISGSFGTTFTVSALTALTLPTTGTVATLAGSETFTNKTITAPVIATIVNTGTLTLPTATDTLVARTTTDTLTNKTIAGGSNTITGLALTTAVTGILPPANGGTGVANNAASTLTIAGSFATTLTISGATNLSLPTSGTVMVGSNNLSDVSTPATARTNLGLAIGSNVQAYDSDLDGISALASLGIVCRTGTGSYTLRTLSAGDSTIVINDGSGTSQNPTINVSTAVIVDKTTSQTLTNKTMSGSSNTFTNISLTSSVTGALPLGNGGTGQTTAAAAITALLPAQGSAANQFLQSNGTSASWVSAVATVKKQVFTANGTYTPSTGMLYCIVEMVGAGGTGGASATGGGAAGGAGSGGYSRSLLTAATVGASKAVVVGTSAGAASTFGSTIVVANGGSNGATATTSGIGGLGGAGGAAGTGDLACAGNAGCSGGSATTNICLGGTGGASIFGGAGLGGGVAGAGNAAGAYGSGGGGCGSNASGGGAAGSGVVIITEYCSQ